MPQELASRSAAGRMVALAFHGCYALMSGGVAALGRSHIGLEQALRPRYCTISQWLIVGILGLSVTLLAENWWRKAAQSRNRYVCGGSALSAGRLNGGTSGTDSRSARLADLSPHPTRQSLRSVVIPTTCLWHSRSQVQARLVTVTSL